MSSPHMRAFNVANVAFAELNGRCVAATVSVMEIVAVLAAGFVIALAISSIRSRRNLRSCCSTDAANDLRMRDAS